ncbi:hypothetical protein IAI10_20345 [Clostridium sp. 19966]|uniref:hypothetical protein n=1 Tax=Clostridium sp. 19966 TaxID=2768166 RepID=UPI0028E05F51|nr:hypothetical protein [Clostridium sp. 19966]MDT8719008.1 hypothetical protein [Clostridium sp. 19966]
MIKEITIKKGLQEALQNLDGKDLAIYIYVGADEVMLDKYIENAEISFANGYIALGTSENEVEPPLRIKLDEIVSIEDFNFDESLDIHIQTTNCKFVINN